MPSETFIQLTNVIAGIQTIIFLDQQRIVRNYRLQLHEI